MAAALEHSLRRLAIHDSFICQSCRRTLTTTSVRRQPPPPASRESFADLVSNSRISPAPANPQPRSPSATNALSSSVRSSQSQYDVIHRAIRDSTQSAKEEVLRDSARRLRGQAGRAELEQQMPRRWKAGDVYAPHDLSGVEASKWKKFAKKPRPKQDVIDQLGLNPLREYKNVSIMSEYMTEMGRIRHGNEMGLRPVNQRKMAKAIRRAIGIGLMPGVHRHPELLRSSRQQ